MGGWIIERELFWAQAMETQVDRGSQNRDILVIHL